MSATFPKTRRNRLGYDIDQVEDFLEDARRAYTAERGEVATVSSADIRRTAFVMKKGGYSPEHVDAALERLEDAFAMRERVRLTSEKSDDTLVNETRAIAQEIVDRLARPAGNRFDRVNLLASGYRRSDVDRFTDKISGYLTSGAPLAASEVRSVAFRPQRGGYREAQVDLLLDAVVDILQTVE